MKKLFWTFFLLIFSIQVCAIESQRLKEGDVKKVMNEMLSQHVEKKKVTAPFLKQAVGEYIDQFDPQRIYLLDSEVKALLLVDQERLEKLYQENDYSIFRQVDQKIQESILRAQKYRHEIYNNLSKLPQEDPAEGQWRESEVKRDFAKSESELKKRIQSEIQNFISIEKKRYGESAVNNKVLSAYESHLKHNEKQYLYQDDNGVKISAEDQENLFTMHILKAFAKTLDAHSSFFSQTEASDMRMRLEKDFKGIGIILERKPEGVVITKLIKGGPAEKSGQILVNDQVIKINGSDVADDSLDTVMDKMRDNTHPSISLTIKRGTGIVTVNLKKESIQLNDERASSSYVNFGGGILGKITLTSFYQGDNGVSSEKDIRHQIAELKKHGEIKGLILDLRDNSGGFLVQAVKVAGLFITNGVVVISKYSDGQEKFYRDLDGKTVYDGPLIILTSKTTASAAEIVAEAIQDYGVGIIVGDDRTYGKGTIQTQTVTNNESHSFFKVTVGKYYTVSGKTPQIHGVKADIVVPGRWENKQVGEVFAENPIGNDTIKSAYVDELKDVEPNLKPWYKRYYTPTVQEKKSFWTPHLSNLRKNSAIRMANNPEYAKFLKQEGEWSRLEDNKKDDPQMVEALNILKEMVEVSEQNIVTH